MLKYVILLIWIIEKNLIGKKSIKYELGIFWLFYLKNFFGSNIVPIDYVIIEDLNMMLENYW